MNKKKIITLVSSTLFLFGGYGAITNPSLSQNVIAKVKTIIKYDHSAEKKTKQIAQENKQTEKKIVSLDKKIAKLRKELKKYTGKHNIESVSACLLYTSPSPRD